MLFLLLFDAGTGGLRARARAREGVIQATVPEVSFLVLRKSAGVPLLRLNSARRPMVDKYSDGKMQRILKREFCV